MNEILRVDKLKEIKNGKAERSGIPLVLEGQTIFCEVYKIPLEYLVYNKYNGRIGTRVKSYEKQHGFLNPENKKDKGQIETFLFDSNKGRNKTTLNDLKKYRQLKHGIVTSTGKIIDGNRRAMLLNRLYSDRENYNAKGEDVSWSKYFIAIILDDSISDDEKKIQELETLVQIGEDSKVDYNSIEKYLKCKELSQFAEIEDIARWMNTPPADIAKRLSTMELMDDYLVSNGYDGIYTSLDKKEDPFLFLNDSLAAFSKGSSYVNWDYDTEFDVHTLKEISFDYIRAGYEGKEFRQIAKRSKKNGFFCNESIWNNFLKRHEEKKTLIFSNAPEKSVDEMINELPNAELTDVFKKRDEVYESKFIGALKENVGRSQFELDNINEANEFLKLLEKANKAIDSINRNNDDYYCSEEALNLIKEISRKLWDDKKAFEQKTKDD